VLDIGVLLATFALIFVSELPDKTAIASLVLGTRFPLRWVFVGVAAAFVVHVVIAVAAGKVLTLLPHNAVESVIAVLFILGAVLIWREGSEDTEELESAEEEGLEETATDERKSFWKVAGLGFGVIFIGEWGDLTQIMTANLSAKYDDPLSVGIGAVLGLWGVALTAMLFGRTLLKVIPMRTITRIAAVVMVALAVVTIVGIIK
jgi:Ca2+/H+ antiporter, TMEM165/GDT1 family